jgi:hypothetical protein
VLTVLAMITALAVAQGSAATPVSEKAVVHAVQVLGYESA